MAEVERGGKPPLAVVGVAHAVVLRVIVHFGLDGVGTQQVGSIGLHGEALSQHPANQFDGEVSRSWQVEESLIGLGAGKGIDVHAERR